MKIFKSDDYIKMQNPNPGKPYRPEILTAEHGAKNLGGMFGLLAAGTQVPYHYHNNRESVMVCLVYLVDDVFYRAGDIDADNIVGHVILDLFLVHHYSFSERGIKDIGKKG